MSDLDLYADLITRKLVSSDGGAVTLSPFVLGDQLRCSLRTYERSESGDLRERDLRVRTLRASIGKVLTAPTAGTFKLWIGDTDTPDIDLDANADVFKTAVQGSGIIDTVENPATSTWVVKTTRADSEAPYPIYVHTNKLAPISFVRVRQFKQLGVWWFECRLIQAPLAFNSGHERVLPKPPTMRRIRAGNGGSETEPPSNEIQALLLPPEFRGTYFLRWNYRVSKLLGIEDGPDEIAAALSGMFEKGKRFEATNPEPDNAYIEFIGELAGAPQPLITVEVNTFAPGTLTFTLPLDRAEMAAALRAVPELEVPFEVEAEIVEDGEDIADPAVPGRIITFFQQAVKVVREQIWEEMETVQPIDWMRPPQPRDYIPFTPDQIIFGVQHYVAVFGDGESRSFSFPHNLGTEAFHLTVRQNQSAGKVIADFDATIASANDLTLDFPANEPPPAPNSLALVISSAGPRSAFLAHTHTIAQILGLLDALAGIYARLENIEDLLSTPNLLTRRDDAVSQEIEIPDFTEVFPGARLPADFDPKSLSEGKTDKLPRPAGLLPAIHDATVVPIAVPLPRPEANAGNVFQNTTNVPLLVPGGLGRRGGYLDPQGYAGSDGRVWYRLSRAAQTNSFYPLDFERELFLLHINEAMWQPDGRFSVEFDLELQLFLANTRAQFLVVIEAGSGGRAGVGTLRVSGVGTPGIQLGTAYPGFSGGFEFKNVPVNPGGTITYTADYGEPGNAPLTHHTGTGSHKFEPFCLIFGASWHGTMTEDKSCEHDGPSGNTEDGYTYNASYGVNGQYAVNPENGSGKSAQRTPVDVNEGEPHIHWTNDTRPDGTHTEGDIAIYPPGSVTVDVNNGGVSNLQPDTLGMFGESESNETQDPDCSFEKTVDEGSSL